MLIIGHVSVGVFGFKMASGSSRWVSSSMLAVKSILHLRPFENNCVEIQCIEYYFVMKWVLHYNTQARVLLFWTSQLWFIQPQVILILYNSSINKILVSLEKKIKHIVFSILDTLYIISKRFQVKSKQKWLLRLWATRSGVLFLNKYFWSKKLRMIQLLISKESNLLHSWMNQSFKQIGSWMIQ